MDFGGCEPFVDAEPAIRPGQAPLFVGYGNVDNASQTGDRLVGGFDNPGSLPGISLQYTS